MTEPGAAILAHIAALGPFFAVHTHDPGLPTAPPWRPMSELTHNPATLLDRVSEVRSHLAAAGGRPDTAVELRVAASVTHLGMTARLLAPALALATLGGITRPLDLTDLRWQPTLGGPFPLSLPNDQLRTGPSARPTPTRWAADLVNGLLLDLVEATGGLSLSPLVMWGNVASAVNGTATTLAAAAPAHAPRARELATLLLEQSPVRNTSSGTAGTPQFRRRTCCLIYRAAPKAAGAVCGDCVLAGR